MEAQIVCEDDIVESLLVARELFFMAMRVAPVKVAVTNIFRFDIEDRHTVLGRGDIVWSTTIHPFGLVCDSELWQLALHQLLQGASVGMFSGIACPELLIDGADIF